MAGASARGRKAHYWARAEAGFAYLSYVVRWAARGGSGPAQTLQVAMGNVLVVLLNGVSGIVTARMLGVGGRGTLAAILTWPQTMCGVSTLGIPPAITYHMRTNPEDAPELLVAATMLAYILGAVGALIGALLIVPAALGHYPQWVIRQAQFLMLMVPVGVHGSTLGGILQARMRFQLMNLVQWAPSILNLVSLIALFGSGRLTATTAAASILLAGVPIVVLLHVLLVRSVGARVPRSWKTVWSLLSYGVRSYPPYLLGVAATVIDQAVVLSLLGPVSLGLYIVALRSTRYVTLPALAAASVLIARTAGRGLSIIVPAAERAVRTSTLASLSVAVIAALLAPWLLTLAYGPDYRDATLMFRLFAFEAVLSGMASVLVEVFCAEGRPGLVSTLQVGNFACLLLMLAVVTPVLGPLGAALSVLVSTTLKVALLLLCFPAVLHRRPPRWIPNRADAIWALELIRRRSMPGEASAVQVHEQRVDDPLK